MRRVNKCHAIADECARSMGGAVEGERRAMPSRGEIARACARVYTLEGHPGLSGRNIHGLSGRHILRLSVRLCDRAEIN